MYNTYVKSGCVRKVRRFLYTFKDLTAPNEKPIHTTVNKLRQTGSLLHRNELNKTLCSVKRDWC
jgi:hypothetical protein